MLVCWLRFSPPLRAATARDGRRVAEERGRGEGSKGRAIEEERREREKRERERERERERQRERERAERGREEKKASCFSVGADAFLDPLKKKILPNF